MTFLNLISSNSVQKILNTLFSGIFSANSNFIDCVTKFGHLTWYYIVPYVDKASTFLRRIVSYLRNAHVLWKVPPHAVRHRYSAIKRHIIGNFGAAYSTVNAVSRNMYTFKGFWLIIYKKFTLACLFTPIKIKLSLHFQKNERRCFCTQCYHRHWTPVSRGKWNEEASILWDDFHSRFYGFCCCDT